jgi:ornithine cyclodeaminase/alanine dehydrogenase
VAVDCLAPREPVALGVLGSGLEARTHVEAIAAVRPIRSLRVFSPREERRKAFAAEFAEQLGIRAEAVASAQEAVTGATLVLAAARSYDETPVLHGAWLSEGMLVVSIGSTLPEQREIDAELVARCDAIVCDAVDEVVEETGDMLAARAAGVVFEQKLVSLNAVVTGDARKLVSKARLPMYKSVGAAIQDVVVAEHAFELAVAAGLAAPLPTEFTSKPT